MNPRAEIWNVLHDGGIVAIESSVPGDVAIRVNIPYVREMFSADGEDIIVSLANCTTLSMKVWEKGIVSDGLECIVGTGASILSTESESVPVSVFTTVGELEIDFEDFSLSLESGKQITFEGLCDACERYWNCWENEGKALESMVRRTRRNRSLLWIAVVAFSVAAIALFAVPGSGGAAIGLIGWRTFKSVTSESAD